MEWYYQLTRMSSTSAFLLVQWIEKNEIEIEYIPVQYDNDQFRIIKLGRVESMW